MNYKKIIIGVSALTFIASLCMMLLIKVQSQKNSPEIEADIFIQMALKAPLNIYRDDTGSYPTTKQGLEALIISPKGVMGWHGPYLRIKQIPRDPWGNEYQYVYPGTHNLNGYDLWSLGSSSGSDPKTLIGNWENEPTGQP